MSLIQQRTGGTALTTPFDVCQGHSRGSHETLKLRVMTRHDRKEAEHQVGRPQGKGLGPWKYRNEAADLLPDLPAAWSSSGSSCLRRLTDTQRALRQNQLL